jgi:hypothetical protein
LVTASIIAAAPPDVIAATTIPSPGLPWNRLFGDGFLAPAGIGAADFPRVPERAGKPAEWQSQPLGKIKAFG